MRKEIILYCVAAILVLLLLITTFFPGVIYAFKDSTSSGNEKCKPEPGYTEQEWKEHMSHHPNIYKECLT